MTAPLVAIVGSLNTSRTDYEPPIRNVPAAKQACEELGRALAETGCRIVVYSSEPGYIEADVVRGYVASGRADRESIQVRYPQSLYDPAFPEQQTHPDLFDLRADGHSTWEVSFYRSLKDADGGIVILGGGRSALVAGLVAQQNRTPLVALATFGGSAQTVWTLSAGSMASEAERNLMGSPMWRADSAARLVQALSQQRDRLAKEVLEQKRIARAAEASIRDKALLTTAFIIGASLSTLIGTFGGATRPVAFGALFLATPLLAGASGGMARILLDVHSGRDPVNGQSPATAVVLGMIAGLIAAVLFVLAQLATNPEIKNLATAIPAGLNLLLPFELVIGFIAGLTLDTVYSKLQKTDVVNVQPIAAPSSEA